MCPVALDVDVCSTYQMKHDVGKFCCCFVKVTASSNGLGSEAAEFRIASMAS